MLWRGRGERRNNSSPLPPNSKLLTTLQAELTNHPNVLLFVFAPTRSFLGSPRKEESELSKSTLFTKKPLDNSPTQINTDRRDKENGYRFPWLPQYKVPPATAMRINHKVQKHGISSSIRKKKIPLQ